MEVIVEVSIFSRFFGGKTSKDKGSQNEKVSDLTSAKIDVTYEIKAIRTEDMEMKNFLFSLGCFEGENITVISVLADNYIINIKDARYSIDTNLAKAIII